MKPEFRQGSSPSFAKPRRSGRGGFTSSNSYSIPGMIEVVRDGRPIPEGWLERFLGDYMAGRASEAQAAAFLMAVVLRGLSDHDTARLTTLMLDSGERLSPSAVGSPVLDKHSTGGVGDKVSLVLAPLVAELGGVVPMISGRGLAHTGGTLDKLESIDGLGTSFSPDGINALLEQAGAAIVSQTEGLAPLDRRLYALRDLTATVSSVPLVASSIMSKKLAEGLDALVLDVKVGSGGNLPEEKEARAVARAMVAIGEAHDLPTRALLTAMDRPLGRAIGNQLELVEAIHALRGEGPSELAEVVVHLAGEMLEMGGLSESTDVGREQARACLRSGRALERFRRMVTAQGGNPRFIDEPDRFPAAPVEIDVRSHADGMVQSVSPKPLGRSVVAMGGGREMEVSAIDHRVGYEVLVSPGDVVEAEKTPLGRVHAPDPAAAEEAHQVLRASVQVGDGEASSLPVVLDRVISG